MSTEGKTKTVKTQYPSMQNQPEIATKFHTSIITGNNLDLERNYAEKLKVRLCRNIQ